MSFVMKDMRHLVLMAVLFKCVSEIRQILHAQLVVHLESYSTDVRMKVFLRHVCMCAGVDLFHPAFVEKPVTRFYTGMDYRRHYLVSVELQACHQTLDIRLCDRLVPRSTVLVASKVWTITATASVIASQIEEHGISPVVPHLWLHPTSHAKQEEFQLFRLRVHKPSTVRVCVVVLSLYNSTSHYGMMQEKSTDFSRCLAFVITLAGHLQWY